MAERFWRKKAILAKIESVYGTDPTPTGADNAILATNVQLTPLEGREIQRGLDMPYLGSQGDILVEQHVALSLEVEMAGAGAAGDVPGYGVLLRACGLAETIDEDVDVQYDPVSGAFESATIHIHIDGVRHILRGARGNVVCRLRPSDIPRFAFSFRGLLGAVADAALPTTETDGFQTPLPASTTNTPTFTLHGLAGVLEELELDLGHQVEGRFLVGAEKVAIVDRRGTGRAVIEAGALSAKDWFAIARARTRGPLQIVHGTTAGNIVAISAPSVEIGRPSYGNTQGIVNLSLPLGLVADEGDDELKITVR